MTNRMTWHEQAISQLSQLLEQDSAVKALILTGSLADAEVQEDAWSDVDAKIIVSDHALEHYFPSDAWLSPLGQCFGAERYDAPLTKTHRVFLDGFRHFDLTFIPESALLDAAKWDHNPFYPSYLVRWSKLPDLETYVKLLPRPAEYQDETREVIKSMIDAFWFKAAVAITKVVRNDLLIGMHLALDLVRDCLVVQMIRRDRAKRTVIHRTGGWGNDITRRLSLGCRGQSSLKILDCVRMSCEIFDELVAELDPDYKLRGAYLYPHIETAKQRILT